MLSTKNLTKDKKSKFKHSKEFDIFVEVINRLEIARWGKEYMKNNKLPSPFVPHVWSEACENWFKNKLETNKVITKMISKDEFIKAVEEYQTLNRWQWFRKRKLEKQIAVTAKYWLEDIKSIKKKEKIVFKIPKIKEIIND